MMENFTKEINAKRKTGTWYSYAGVVEGKEIRIKGYKTWLQIFDIDGVDNSGCMDISVGAFNELLEAVVR